MPRSPLSLCEIAGFYLFAVMFHRQNEPVL